MFDVIMLCLILSTDLLTPNFIQNTDILITRGNKSAEIKGFECAIAYNNTESTFLHHVFYINFDKVNRKSRIPFSLFIAF